MADTIPSTGTPAGNPFEHLRGTAAQILEAQPLDLVRMLCGSAVLTDLRTHTNPGRAHLVAAHAALGGLHDGRSPELAGAVVELQRGIAASIRPDGITCNAETVLLQCCLWLLHCQVLMQEAIALYDIAAPGRNAKH
ncbi:MAG: hypothetical protein IPG93_10930 [Burkholderiales bacterium]|nr:hypothetical protein [Burkholderiales bacterium]